MDQGCPSVAADVELAPTTGKPLVKDTPPSYVVTFQQPFDAENPQQWPNKRKWAVTNVLSATGFNRIMVSTVMAPALPIISRELNMTTTEGVMALSIYVLATAFGPLFFGPLSEIYGRTAILHASNVWFLVWNIACGFANTKGLLIAARLLAGFGASSVYALGGGVLGDVWSPEQRGKTLGIYLAIPLTAVAVGPIIGGVVTARADWRWMFWATSIFQAIMVVFCFTTFSESHGPTILKRRANKLRRETGNENYQTPEEFLNRSRTVVGAIGHALTRPFRLLLFHPIIQICALVSAFEYGLLYIVLTSFASVWTEHYHQSTQSSGLHYIAIALGELVGAQVGGPLMDVLYRRAKKHAVDGEHKPEHRMPLSYPTTVLAAAGLIMYGWTAQYLVHWCVVDVAIFIVMFAGQIMSMPLQAYTIDAYPDHTSSALAASQFLRSLTAFSFPLFAPAMYEKLMYGWGNTTMAFLWLIIGLASPWIIWRYGEKLRAKAQSSF